ncbi:hypothetical protein [Haematobacter sp.]|nr:hypothetical protein [Haematobacter sp.]
MRAAFCSCAKMRDLSTHGSGPAADATGSASTSAMRLTANA